MHLKRSEFVEALKGSLPTRSWKSTTPSAQMSTCKIARALDERATPISGNKIWKDNLRTVSFAQHFRCEILRRAPTVGELVIALHRVPVARIVLTTWQNSRKAEITNLKGNMGCPSASMLLSRSIPLL